MQHVYPALRKEVGQHAESQRDRVRREQRQSRWWGQRPLMSIPLRRSGAAVLLVASVAICLLAAPAHAQTDERIPATGRVELGPYDDALKDWPIRAVQLSGGLLEGRRVAVQLLGTDGSVLGEGE